MTVAMPWADILFMTKICEAAQLKLGQVTYQDFAKDADPVEVLVAAAQSMAPLTDR